MFDPIWASRARIVVISLFLAIAGLLGYAVRQHYQVTRLSAENDLMVSTLKDTRAQVTALTAKIDSLTAPPAAQPFAQPAAPVKAHRLAAPRHEPDVVIHHYDNDVRITRLQTQLDAQGRTLDAQGHAIETTRQELSSARTELEGGIARTHEELVVLQKKGERNYFEFDLYKSKQFQRSGPVSISLRKANREHQYANLELRMEDAQVSQKHVNVLQPVMFYTTEYGRPVELVINSISKDHIHGYVSAPRYSSAELAANTSNRNGDANAPPIKRQKLEVPR